MSLQTRFLICFIVISAAWLHAEDEVVTSSGAKISGWIVQLSPDSAFVLDERQSRKVPLAGSTLKFDFASQRRCAVVTAGRNTIAVEVDAFKDGILEGKNSNGEKWSAALKDITSAELYPTARLTRTLPVTHERQKPDYCGEACVAMVSNYLGKPVKQDQVNAAGGLDGKRGVYSNELERAIADLKLKTGAVAAAYPDRDADDALLDRWRLIQALERGRPVLMGFWADPERKSANFNFDHFVLLVGYNLDKGAMIIHDPGGEKLWERSFGQFAKHRQTRSNLVYQIEFPLQRMWTLADGKKIDATFSGFDADRVRLQSSAKTITPALADFSAADRELLEKLK